MNRSERVWVMNCWMRFAGRWACWRTIPNGVRFYYRDFRRLLTRRFPYKLFYRVEGDRVIVFRILHAKRKHQREL